MKERVCDYQLPTERKERIERIVSVPMRPVVDKRTIKEARAVRRGRTLASLSSEGDFRFKKEVEVLRRSPL